MKILFTVLVILLFTSCSEEKTTTPEPKASEFCTDIDNMPEGLEGTYVRIVAVLPNPSGNDDYNEKFEIKSFKDSIQNFSLYYILDDENVRWDLGKLNFAIIDNAESGNCRSVIYISDKVAQLHNSGDTIYLYNPDGVLIQTVSYGQSKDGEWVNLRK